ncbi:MAG: hypothetical protein V1703_00110 [Candidatus Altiarchaeota archaeon]
MRRELEMPGGHGPKELEMSGGHGPKDGYRQDDPLERIRQAVGRLAQGLDARNTTIKTTKDFLAHPAIVKLAIALEDPLIFNHEVRTPIANWGTIPIGLVPIDTRSYDVEPAAPSKYPAPTKELKFDKARPIRSIGDAKSLVPNQCMIGIHVSDEGPLVLTITTEHHEDTQIAMGQMRELGIPDNPNRPSTRKVFEMTPSRISKLNPDVVIMGFTTYLEWVAGLKDPFSPTIGMDMKRTVVGTMGEGADALKQARDRRRGPNLPAPIERR